MLSYIGAAMALWFAVDVWIAIVLLDARGAQRSHDR